MKKEGGGGGGWVVSCVYFQLYIPEGWNLELYAYLKSSVMAYLPKES